jgi:hypothetical protein
MSMPKLTSLTSDVSDVPEGPNSWEIKNTLKKGVLSIVGWTASRQDVTIQLGFDGGPDRSIECHNYSYLVTLQIQEIPHEFTIFPRSELSKSAYRVYPDIVTVAPMSARLEVSLKGDGKVVYREAWKDSDTAKNIKGFIDSTGFSRVEAEEAMVWLIGTLAIRGLPLVESPRYPY